MSYRLRAILERKFSQKINSIRCDTLFMHDRIDCCYHVPTYNHVCALCAGLMEQWLIEGKFTEEEVLMMTCDMLVAGIDTVSLTSIYLREKK